MKYKKYLSEKFNLHYPTFDIRSFDYQWSGEFKVENTTYTFEADQYFPKDLFTNRKEVSFLDYDQWIWAIEFMADDYEVGKKSPWDISGKMGSKAVFVFSGVGTLLKKFISAKKPNAFFFSAKEPSRVRLYDSMSKLIVKKIPYKFKKIDVPHRNTYIFYK